MTFEEKENLLKNSIKKIMPALKNLQRQDDFDGTALTTIDCMHFAVVEAIQEIMNHNGLNEAGMDEAGHLVLSAINWHRAAANQKTISAANHALHQL